MNEDELVDLLAEYDEIIVIDRHEPNVLTAEDGTVVATVEERTVIGRDRQPGVSGPGEGWTRPVHTSGGGIAPGVATLIDGVITSASITADRLAGYGEPLTMSMGSMGGSSVTIGNDGSITTRDNQGNDVIRIDMQGIHINGRLILNGQGVPPPQAPPVRTEEGGNLSGLIGALLRDRARTGR